MREVERHTLWSVLRWIGHSWQESNEKLDFFLLACFVPVQVCSFDAFARLSSTPLDSPRCLDASKKDAPEFAWRGLMLDVSRHFFSPTAVKHLLKTMVCRPGAGAVAGLGDLGLEKSMCLPDNSKQVRNGLVPCQP